MLRCVVTEAGESPLVVQLQQHIQRKCTQSKLLSQRLTDYEAQEAILLGEASKDLPLTICRIIARQSTGNTQRQGMKEEADNVGEVFTATGDALEVSNPLHLFCNFTFSRVATSSRQFPVRLALDTEL